MSIEERVQHRLNVLEACLCENAHIHQREDVQRLMNRITKWYDTLNNDDKAYVDSAKRIISEQIPYDGS